MNTAASFAPLEAATGKVINLSMERLWLAGQVLPAGARLIVQHVFRSSEEKGLEVIYAFPLPRDAALRSFRISGEGFEAHSELKETRAAVESYEHGIAKGSLSALVRQYGDGLVNLTVGNIRPKETVTIHLEILCGVELKDSGFRFRFPFTLAPAYHARAKTALTEPGEGEMELPADEFGDMILPRFRQDASSLHQVGFELTTTSQLALSEIGSPSHTIRVKRDGMPSAHITLAIEKDIPNRDLVLDVGFQSIEPQILAGIDKAGLGRFAAIVPSTSFGSVAETTRRIVILLDRSASMKGTPMQQARKAVDACLGSLSETDSFGLVAFDDKIQTFHPSMVPGSREMRDRAHQFLTQVDARGGTEIVAGILEAARILDGSGDVFVVTDGQVAGTEQILELARSAGLRLHCLGIGSASQDRFLALLAGETGGVSRFVTPGERVDLTAVDLFASAGRPIVTGLEVSGNLQPEPPSCVFSGTPVLLFGESGEAIDGHLELSWTGGRLNLPVTFSDASIAETLWLLQGSRLITHWESKYPPAFALAPLELRKQNRVGARLLELSQTYGLASREMSLVAVVTRRGDRAGDLPQTRVVPVGMPQDAAFGAYFGAGRSGLARPLLSRDLFAASFGQEIGECSLAPISSNAKKARRGAMILSALLASNTQPPPAVNNPDDILLDLATRMEPDGGMPGENKECRALATAIALLAFLSKGHTIKDGAFRSHVARLVQFLRSVTGLSIRRQQALAAVINLANKGTPPKGDWIDLAGHPGDYWKEVETAVP